MKATSSLRGGFKEYLHNMKTKHRDNINTFRMFDTHPQVVLDTPTGILKAVTALTGRLSLCVGWEYSPVWGCDCFI